MRATHLRRPQNRVSAGHLAARGGHLQALSLLVDAGLNVRADTLDRCATTTRACAVGAFSFCGCRWLPQCGLPASPEPRALFLPCRPPLPPSPPCRVTLLHEAAKAGHVPVVEWLLARGLDPNVRSLGDRATALELAIVEGCHQAATALRCAERV